MVDERAEGEERDPANRAREALARYHDTDPTVPLGGLPMREYERALHEVSQLDPAMLAPHEAFETGWLEFEYMLAMMRGATNPATGEPYTTKNIAAAKEAFRQRMSQVTKYEFAPPELKARAKAVLLDIPYHEEIIRYGKKAPREVQHTKYLRGLQQIGRELLAEDLSADGHTYADTLAVQMLLTEYSLDTAWFLQAAPRQPWHLTAHNTEVRLPDQFLVMADEGPEEYTLIPQGILQTGFDESQDHPLLRAYIAMPAAYSIARKVTLSTEAAIQAFRRYKDVLFTLNERLFAGLSAQFKWQLAHGITPTRERAKQTAAEEAKPREMFPDALWYLTDYSEQTPLQTLIARTEALEVLRRTEGLSADEQRILGWMQLEHAVALGRNAQGDKKMLDDARARFGDVMDSFTRAFKAFNGKRMPGDALDMLLALEAHTVYRALFTSTDPYAVKRAATSYPRQLEALLADISKHRDKVKADDTQLKAFLEVVTRTTVCLLQSGATEETARHLIVPAPIRLNSPVLAAYTLDVSGRVATYDTANPVSILLAEGDSIKAKPGVVVLGRDAVMTPDNPFKLFEYLLKPAPKQKKKGGKPQTPADVRGAETDDLSVKLGDKIFDASEGVDDDIEE